MLGAMYQTTTGMWCDGLCSSTSSTSFHAQHYPLWLGITPDSGVEAAVRYLQSAGMVGSTYSSHSLIHGLYERAASLDHGQAALELMTQCGEHSWCAMLKADATTTWEHWYPHDGTHSHPWSTTPASAVASGLMGVRPTAPGWSRWVAKPAPGNLSVASIVVPTPRGPITANYTRQNGRPQLELTIPPQTEATACMPLFGASPSEVALSIDGVATKGHVEQSGALRAAAYLCADEISSKVSGLDADGGRVTIAVVPHRPVGATSHVYQL
jgi:hypothetical protein